MLVFTRRYVCVKAKLTFLSLCPVVFRNLSLLSQSVMPYLLYMSPPTLPPLHCTVRLREGSRGPKRWIFASGKTPQLKISLMSIYLERVTCSSGFLVQNCPYAIIALLCFCLEGSESNPTHKYMWSLWIATKDTHYLNSKAQWTAVVTFRMAEKLIWEIAAFLIDNFTDLIQEGEI